MTMNDKDVQKEWELLDPILVRGMQRSGTSILYRVLKVAGFAGFPEGHLWQDVVKPLARLYDPDYQRGQTLKQKYFALGEGRHTIFEKYIALAIDRYHRDMLSAESGRWFDKSPGSYAVEVLPMLTQLFPRSQIIFVYRNPVAVVHSGVTLWAKSNPNIFQLMCRGWARTMSVWRRLKGLLEGKYIELSQEMIAQNPDEAANTIVNFLQIPERQALIAEVFCSRRENSAFPDKQPGDYEYQIEWNEEQKAFLLNTCEEEMEAWGYPIDFSSSAGGLMRKSPLPSDSPVEDMASYYAWLSDTRLLSLKQRVTSLESENASLRQERDELRATLEQIQQDCDGRISNKILGFLQRLKI